MRLCSIGDPPLLKAMGLDGVVLCCKATPGDIGALAEQARKAQDYGLKVEAVMPEWGLIEQTIQDPDHVDNVLALLDEMARLGLSDLHTSCGLTLLDSLSEDRRRTYRSLYSQHLGQIYERATALGLYVGLHHTLRPGIHLGSVDVVDQWLARFPMDANAILLCVGCTESAGLDTLALIDKWLPRIRAVHIRNVVGSFADDTARDVRLDSGTLDMPSVFRKLAAVGYDGPVMPEHFPELPCDNGRTVSQAFALGHCRALIQASHC